MSLGEALSTLMFALLGLALLLFPDGRPPSRRWRKLLWILGAAALFGVVGLGLRPGHFAETEAFDTYSNPLGVGSDPEPFDALGGLSWLLVTSGMVACGVAMVRRMRRAHGIERLQLKWIAFAASLFAVGFLVISITFFVELSGSIIDPLRTAVLGFGFCTIPIAAGIAILRYRLYDIDVVINRTLVYGALTAILAGVYIGSVLLLQLLLRPLTADSNLAIAGSTLAVAALFRPARTRIQGAVDRRFFRRKYDAARTLERFGNICVTRSRSIRSAPSCAQCRRDDATCARSLWLREADARQLALQPARLGGVHRDRESEVVLLALGSRRIDAGRLLRPGRLRRFVVRARLARVGRSGPSWRRASRKTRSAGCSVSWA